MSKPTPMPTVAEVEALAREMVEDRWPYTYRWDATSQAERQIYLGYARMVLKAAVADKAD